MNPEKENDGKTPAKYDQFVGYACGIEAMIGACVDAYTDQLEQQMERTLAWIAENPDHPDRSATAAEWLKLQMDLGRIDPAGRLSRAISTGKVRASSKGFAVYLAVAAFLRENRRWPERSEIVIAGVSDRTRDAVFQEIEEAFNVEIDGRVRCVNPQ